MKTKFRILNFGGFNEYIDETRLHNGIYITNKPILHEAEDTIEQMIDRWTASKDILGESFVMGETIENLKKCDLIEVELTPINEN
jgi:hypothetical protein